MADPIRIGIVGATVTPGGSGWGANAHIPALKALPVTEDCPEAVVMVLAVPVAPHAWRVADGGVAVAPGRWVRRYAALPADARLGAWVHEMAHLLLGWPDLPGSPCLMGHGAAREGGPREGQSSALQQERLERERPRLRGRVERDAATGEIVRRRP